jgi:RimJ/RimL family protein N-acetyltransferase
VLPYAGFLADPEVRLWLDERAQRGMAAAEVESILFREAWCLWSIECESRFIGVTSLYEPDLTRGCARFAIVIGDKSCWGQGIGGAALKRVLDHGFTALGLRKINSDYFTPHVASRRMHERAGFVFEGRLREDAWRQGRWVDRDLVSLLRKEYQQAAG